MNGTIIPTIALSCNKCDRYHVFDLEGKLIEYMKIFHDHKIFNEPETGQVKYSRYPSCEQTLEQLKELHNYKYQ